MKRQNILHLVEYLYLGGIERLLEQLAFKTGDRVNLHFFTYETESLEGIGKQIQQQGYPVFIYKKKSGRDWKLLSELIRVVKENKIEVIHTHDFGPMEYAFLLKLRFPKIRLVHTQHTIFQFIKNRKYVLFFQFVSYFYNKIIVVSNYVLETLLTHCLITNRSSFAVIPNGVDTDFFSKTKKDLNNDQLNLVSVSRISQEKNISYLLNTCRLLKESGIPFIFHHVGTAKSSAEINILKQYIKANSLEDRVVLHGILLDVKPVLDLGDIFLSASFTEGHPVAVLEAMACEKLCFCSDISAHRELGIENLNLFDLSDEKSLALLLESRYRKRSCEDYGTSDRCVIARLNVEKNFSLQKMVDNYLQQYN